MSNFDYGEIDSQPTLQDAIDELASNTGKLPGPSVLYGLSNLSTDDLRTLQPIWDGLDKTYRRVLMQMMVDAMDEHFELNYRPIAEANLSSEQPEVRQASIEMLWEATSISLMDRFITIATTDPVADVREEATKALGRFVLWGELGDLPESETERAQNALIAILDDDAESSVQCYALEGIANCSREGVAKRIQVAYDSGEALLQQGAIVAMGHTCDTQRWGTTVLEVLERENIVMRRQAAKSAGELQLVEAVPALLRLLEEDEREGQEIVIWSLGEIGGNEAMRILERIAEMAESTGDDALIDIVDDAIGNASLANGNLMLMTDFTDILDHDLDD